MLAHRLVFVGTVVDDDDLAPRPGERREQGHHLLRLGRVVKQTHGKYCIGAAECVDARRNSSVVILGLDELDVLVVPIRQSARL